ncbi:MAG: ATP-binding protein [Candidatus Desulfofervidus auxilii]|nr:ATP-binding protein [Candidatus Desulfofervidus auxilii]
MLSKKELLEIIKIHREIEKIDFKERLDLSNKPNKAKFAKLVAAIANTLSQEIGYIIVGIKDEKHSSSEESPIVGCSKISIDQLSQMIYQILSEWIEPVPRVNCEEFEIEGKKIIVIEIYSDNPPYMFKRNLQHSEVNIDSKEIPIRRGSHIFSANRMEIELMMKKYCQEKIEEEKRFFTEELDKAKDWEFIAEIACKKLYHKLSKNQRGKVLRSILERKPEYFNQWFGGE